MGVSTSSPEKGPEKGIAVVTVDVPPVNALPVDGWFALADAVRAAGRDPGTRCVVLTARGRGFNAGVDIKELQARGRSALIGANRGCFEAFAAVYECEVPVVAAVHGFCLGGGIGLVGNADVIVASEDAVFGLPELDRGALGAATHLARLVPQHLMRALYYTSRTVTAAELHAHGSVWRVVPSDELQAAARSWPVRSPRRTVSCSGSPRRPSTASTRSTCAAATASSRASPSRRASPGWPTGSGTHSARTGPRGLRWATRR